MVTNGSRIGRALREKGIALRAKDGRIMEEGCNYHEPDGIEWIRGRNNSVGDISLSWDTIIMILGFGVEGYYYFYSIVII